MVTAMLVFASLLSAVCLTSFFSVPYFFETIVDSYRSAQDIPPKYVHWLRLLVDHLAPGLSGNSASYFTPIILIPFAVLGYIVPSSVRLFCLATFAAFVLLAHPFGLFSLVQKLPFQAGNVVTIRFVFFYYLGFALALAFGLDHVMHRKAQISQRVKQIFRISISHLFCTIIAIVMTISMIILLHDFEIPLYFFVLQQFPIQNSFFGPVISTFGLSALVCSIALVISLTFRIDVSRVSLYLFPALLSFNILILAAVLDHVPELKSVHLFNFAISFLFLVLFRKEEYFGRPVLVGFLIVYTISASLVFNSLQSSQIYDLTKTSKTSDIHWEEVANFLNEKTVQKPFRVAGNHDSITRLAKAGFIAEELGYFLPLPPSSIVDFFVNMNGIPAGPAPKQKDLPSKAFRDGNVRYYIRVASTENREQAALFPRGFDLVFSQGPINIYEDKQANPRLAVDSPSTEFAAYQSCLVKEHQTESEMSALIRRPCDSVITLKHYDSGSYDLNVSSPAEGVLVIADRFDDNWNFTVNSKKVSLIKINEFFIGIPIDKGVSEVLGIYKIPALGYMLLLSGVTFLTFVLFLFYLLARNNRRLGLSAN